MRHKFAVQLYSVRDEMEKDLWGTLRKVKTMGYDGVEFYGAFTRTAQELKAALDDTGLVCVGWHTPLNYVTEANALMATITYNKILGNTEIVIPALGGDMVSSKAAWLESAKLFNDLAAKLAPYGMKIAYHNHAYTFTPMEGDLPLHYFYDNTVADVGLQLDNGNAWDASPETDIYAPIVRYPNRIRTLHHKPFSLKTGHATMIGEDDIDWGKFFKLCRDHQNVDWHIVEFECDEYLPQLEGIQTCIERLRKLEDEGVI